MPKHFGKIAGAAAFASVLAMGPVSGAVAASGPEEGPDGTCSQSDTLCLFTGVGFTGESTTISSGSSSQGACVSLADHGWDGQVRSVINTHSVNVALFPNDNCVGGPSAVPAGTGISDLGSFSVVSVWVPPRG
ncbi:peptidase inhibitor family I36 protein [Streptomyces sp. NBRC 109706]|uniref:peptidase inhibitor family I36 protein n=1 Tax=Streptomyces sp. NBRC 109706 TaxID=1550035 RepID=UPI0007819C25|nr:peptidase inhibitor family I36 protein [Streptomyces sp. NBRC 109706]